MTTTGNGALDLAVMMLSDDSNAQLGVVLAVAQEPEIIPKLLAQLERSGPLGQQVLARYTEARNLLETVR
jgi:hypothetical protein